MEAGAKIRRSLSFEFYCPVGRAQNHLGKEEPGSGNPEAGISYHMEKTADLVGCTQDHFLLWSEESGNGNSSYV